MRMREGGMLLMMGDVWLWQAGTSGREVEEQECRCNLLSGEGNQALRPTRAIQHKR